MLRPMIISNVFHVKPEFQYIVHLGAIILLYLTF